MANCLYVLTNEAMAGFVKIGITDQPIANRMRQLDTTGVPLPFELFMAVETERPMREIEAALHDVLAQVRVRNNREFFRIAPERLVKLLHLLGKEITSNLTTAETPEDHAAIEAIRRRRPAFSFEMVNIALGAILTFDYDDTVTCQLAGHRTVVFKGEEIVPMPFVPTLPPRTRRRSPTSRPPMRAFRRLPAL